MIEVAQVESLLGVTNLRGAGMLESQGGCSVVNVGRYEQRRGEWRGLGYVNGDPFGGRFGFSSVM